MWIREINGHQLMGTLKNMDVPWSTGVVGLLLLPP